jgi:Domain of unknown function (DUF1839)
VTVLGALDPATYAPHRLHGADRLFPETNCYVDVWIELLHAHGLEPTAMLAFCAAIDWEGDQWTFFKPPLADLEALYGVEVEELSVYRPLADHVGTLLARGRTTIVEVDAFWLPDVAGRTYRTAHEKTSIAPTAIDPVDGRMRYFHNAGLFEVAGEDYAAMLAAGTSPQQSAVLPGYAELVKLERRRDRNARDLRRIAGGLLARHVARLPERNPAAAFAEQLADDLGRLAGDADAYHAYAFATLRQCGAAWSLLAEFLAWLGSPGHVADHAGHLADTARVLILKLARAARSGRPLDAAENLADLITAWDALAADLVKAAATRVA